MDWRALQRWAEERGYRAAAGSMGALAEARADLRRRGESGEIDDQLYGTVLRRLVEPALPSDGSLVLVAVPRPAHRVRFELAEGPFDALLPPTYVDFHRMPETLRHELEASVLAGSRVERLVGPLKAVASRLGLVSYGRNNLIYVEGLGSYVQLCGYVTDAAPPADDALLAEPRLLEKCADCARCAAACPTRAIGTDRVLVRAHRCLTYANEGSDPWPPWVKPRVHSCWIGCLVCQRRCPANPPLPVVAIDVSFSREETGALLAGADAAAEPVRQALRAKLDQLDLASFEPQLGRNLQALLDKRRR